MFEFGDKLHIRKGRGKNVLFNHISHYLFLSLLLSIDDVTKDASTNTL